MSTKQTILQTLSPVVRDDAERVYDEMAGEAEPDPREVLAILRERGILDDDQLRSAVLALEETRRIDRVARRPPADDVEPYRVLGHLGAGAMGQVLLARDNALGRTVAVKRLLPHAAKRKSLTRRFYREAQVTAQLDHPSIVPIHGLARREDGGLEYAMKLVRGHTLEDYLADALSQWRTKGAVDEDHALPARLERFLHVCDAMAHAHDRSVLHRDLKPENIMVGRYGEVLVMDWGLAKLLEVTDDGPPTEETELPPTRSSKGTQVGTVMGTPRYMSPEQSLGRVDIMDGRSDQYALGLILFEVVSLTPAIPVGMGLEDVLTWAEHAKKAPLRHAHRRGRIPRELAAVIDKATARDPDHRYASVEDLADDVRRYMRDEAVLARPDGIFQRLGRAVSRRRGTVLGLLVFLAFLVVCTGSTTGLLGMGAFQWQRARSEAREDALLVVAQHAVRRGHAVDETLYRFQGLLTGLSYSAEVQMASGERGPAAYAPGELPPGSQHSEAYDGLISLRSPDLQLLDKKGADELGNLAAMGPYMARALLHSAGDTEATATRLRDEGVPAAWARVATARGATGVLPGLADAPSADPRKQLWYKMARKHTGPQWAPPQSDPREQGSVMTVARSLRAPGGGFAGVAALDLRVQTLAEHLDPPTPESSIYLIERAKGRVVLASGDTPTDITGKNLEHAEVLEALAASPDSGFVEFYDGEWKFAAWSGLSAVPWAWVVVAPSSELYAFE